MRIVLRITILIFLALVWLLSWLALLGYLFFISDYNNTLLTVLVRKLISLGLNLGDLLHVLDF